MLTKLYIGVSDKRAQVQQQGCEISPTAAGLVELLQ